MTRAINSVDRIGYKIMPAGHIPREGFGTLKVVGQDARGHRTIGTVTHGFQLSCGDIVTRIEECGPPCEFCRVEIIRMFEERGDGEAGVLISSEQLEWLSTPCRAHSYHCQFALCGVSGCVKHMALNPDDGLMYCFNHFNIVSEATRLEQMEQRYGIIPTRAYQFIRSLFFSQVK